MGEKFARFGDRVMPDNIFRQRKAGRRVVEAPEEKSKPDERRFG